jgi:hypothetical protein
MAHESTVAVKAIGKPNFIRSPASYMPFERSNFA